MDTLLEIIKEIVPNIPWISAAFITYCVCKHGPKSFEISGKNFSVKFRK